MVARRARRTIRRRSCAGSSATSARTTIPPSPLPPQLEQGARTLIVERGPWEAEIPLDALAAAPFPKLVVSGGHHAGFDAVCDVLVERLGAERLVLPGYGHTPQRHPDFNERLAEFVLRAEARRRTEPDAARHARRRERRSSRVPLGDPPAHPRVPELDDLEQVDDVDRERERDERDRDDGDRLPRDARRRPRGTG